jgi:pimeloyl-ACP methyl ester carboxylesterase
MKTPRALIFSCAACLAAGLAEAQMPPAVTVCSEPSAGNISYEDIVAKYADDDSKFVMLEGLDGINTHYKDEGEGPAILLIHSSSGDLKDWDPWVAALRDEYRVVRMDLPAFGLTGAVPSGNYSVDRYLMQVDALMDHLGIERFAIVGASYGGLVAFRYAGTRTDRITALVLSNSAGIEYGGKRGTTERPRDRSGPFKPRLDTVEDRKRFLLTAINYPEKVTPEFTQRKTDYANVVGRDCESHVAGLLYERGNPLRVLSHVRAPALVMWGGASKALSLSTADAFADAMVNAPSVDKIVYDGAGHFIHIGRPDDTARDVKAFFDRHIGE